MFFWITKHDNTTNLSFNLIKKNNSNLRKNIQTAKALGSLSKVPSTVRGFLLAGEAHLCVFFTLCLESPLFPLNIWPATNQLCTRVLPARWSPAGLKHLLLTPLASSSRSDISGLESTGASGRHAFTRVTASPLVPPAPARTWKSLVCGEHLARLCEAWESRSWRCKNKGNLLPAQSICWMHSVLVNADYIASL